uniref:Uncharacterized protein n=1 Tax=viral metagenome TaxID=1070528 RepID=A0A6C0BL89_9ZZZZ
MEVTSKLSGETSKILAHITVALAKNDVIEFSDLISKIGTALAANNALWDTIKSISDEYNNDVTKYMKLLETLIDPTNYEDD